MKGTLTLFHPNAKGTGCAVKISVTPCNADSDGFVNIMLANQQSTGHFPKFDWDGNVWFRLDAMEVAKFLQVFRGECESVEDGKGLSHMHPDGVRIVIRMRHMIEPVPCYSLEAVQYEADGGERMARMLFMPHEALALAIALENVMAPLMFGA